MTKDEALKLALDALTYIHSETSTEEDALIDESITAINEALAQPAQEPTFTTGHCKNKAQPGGCQLHNLHCQFPACDLKPSAQPAQEPVAWIEHHKAGDNLVWEKPNKGTPLYTTPPQPAQEPDCPKCGNNRQVWSNQITGLKTCHRVNCYTVIQEPAQEPEPDELTIAYMSGLLDGKKKRPWVGLTREESLWILDSCRTPETYLSMIKTKLKEKNS